MRYFILLVSMLALTACGSTISRQFADGTQVDAKAGAGGYTLSKEITHTDGTVEKCTVEAASARDLTDASVAIGEDCTLQAHIGRTQGGEIQTKAMVDMFKMFPWAILPSLAGVPIPSVPIPPAPVQPQGLLLPGAP